MAVNFPGGNLLCVSGYIDFYATFEITPLQCTTDEVV